LQAAVLQKGDEVKSLKDAKADKAAIDAAVGQLKQLKIDLDAVVKASAACALRSLAHGCAPPGQL